MKLNSSLVLADNKVYLFISFLLPTHPVAQGTYYKQMPSTRVRSLFSYKFLV